MLYTALLVVGIVFLVACLIGMAMVIGRWHKSGQTWEPGYPHADASPEEQVRPGVGKVE